jgi:hypothetical protein
MLFNRDVSHIVLSSFYTPRHGGMSDSRLKETFPEYPETHVALSVLSSLMGDCQPKSCRCSDGSNEVVLDGCRGKSVEVATRSNHLGKQVLTAGRAAMRQTCLTSK